MAIDTRRVSRRSLRFESYEDLLQEAERLVAAPQARSLGNWTLGQTLAHLTGGMRMSLDGTQLKAPLLVRLIGPFLRNRILRGPMQAGIRAPAAVQKELVPNDAIGAAEALEEMRAVIRRLKSEPQRHRHPVFGRLDRDQWDQLNYRHAELHLSFHEI